jgi:hypothetical protein
MAERKTIERARRDKREGKSASTQAGEFVREEIDHIREGKHGARSAKQAIAIGFRRRAGPVSSCRPQAATRPRRGPASAQKRTTGPARAIPGRSHPGLVLARRRRP